VAPRRLFALDQNFPEPIIAALREAIDCAELVSVRDIGKELPTLDDWELLLRLHTDPREWDGLITCDASMLSLSREMAALERTGLSLVIADGQGHNPIRATGLLLVHIEHICHQTVRHRSQIWTLRAGHKDPDKATRYLEKIADREKVSIETIRQRHAVELVSTPAVAEEPGMGGTLVGLGLALGVSVLTKAAEALTSAEPIEIVRVKAPEETSAAEVAAEMASEAAKANE
jgi:hypothetical protein